MLELVRFIRFAYIAGSGVAIVLYGVARFFANITRSNTTKRAARCSSGPRARTIFLNNYLQPNFRL